MDYSLDSLKNATSTDFSVPDATAVDIRTPLVDYQTLGPLSRDSRGLTTAERLKIMPGDIPIDFIGWNPLLEEEVKISIKKSSPLSNIKARYLDYIIRNFSNLWDLEVRTGPYSDYRMRLGDINYDPSAVYDRFLGLLWTSNLEKQIKMISSPPDRIKTPNSETYASQISPQVWETTSSTKAGAGSILARYIYYPLDNGKFAVFPFVPVIVPLLTSMGIYAENITEFALDLGQYISTELQFLAKQIGGPEAAALKHFIEGGGIIQSALIYLGLSYGEHVTPGDLKSLLAAFKKNPDALLAIRGPLLWRGSEAHEWSIKLSFSVPAVVYVNSGSYHLVDPEGLDRDTYAKILQEAILRWIVLPFRGMLQYQAFGWMSGFTLNLQNPKGPPRTYFSIPTSWLKISCSHDPEFHGIIPQEFTLNLSGNEMIFGDLFDLTKLSSSLKPVAGPRAPQPTGES